MAFSFDTEHPVFLFAHEGNLDALKEAFNNEPGLANQRASNGKSLLHFASESGHLEMVQCLLSDGGSSINERDQNDDTALLLAAENGHLETIQSLLNEGGSKIDERDQYGDSALINAAYYGHLEVVQLLLAHNGVSYRALLSVTSQTRLKLDKEAEALITAKIQDYELSIKRAKCDVPGFVFQETETHVLIKDEFFCPISYELIEEPVVAADGVLYDKKHIEKWFKKGHDTSPITGEKLEHTLTVPELSRQKELIDVHQAIERLYQKSKHRKKP